ncbi:MAG TPA: LysR family transcriptional regulator [Acidimicrobiales bacterium]|jgi:DNA-binding transcriptional LysR family regulator|nr:LysR family transcriptional regulator [Acidimicrobiales bacterium]
MLDPRRLLVLRTLAQRGTVAATAHVLGHTPSAISQQLSTLEREVGIPLLDRDGRSVRLTPLASELVVHAEGIATHLDRADAAVAASRSRIAGPVRVSAFPTAAPLVARAVRAAAAAHAGLVVETVDLEPDDAMTAIAHGDVDLAVAHDYSHDPRPPDPAVHTEPLFDEALVVFAARPRARASLADYAGEVFAAPPITNACGRAVRAACRAAGFEPDVHHHSDDFAVLLAHAAAGNAVALLPASAAGPSTPAVPANPIAEPLTRRVFTAVRTPRRDHPALVALRRHLSDAVRPGAFPESPG